MSNQKLQTILNIQPIEAVNQSSDDYKLILHPPHEILPQLVETPDMKRTLLPKPESVPLGSADTLLTYDVFNLKLKECEMPENKTSDLSPHDLSVKKKCHVGFTNNSKFIRMKCSGQYFKCNSCPFLCIEENAILSHIQSTHANDLNLAKKKWKCPGCSNLFTSRKSLKSHLTIYHLVLKTDLKYMLNLATRIEVNPNEPYHRLSSTINELNRVKIKTDETFSTFETLNVIPDDINNQINTNKDNQVISLQLVEPLANKLTNGEHIYENDSQTNLENDTSPRDLDPKIPTLIITNIEIDNVLNLAQNNFVKCEQDTKVPIPKLEPKFETKKTVKNSTKPKRIVKVTKPTIGDVTNTTATEQKPFKCAMEHCNVRLKTEANMQYHIRCHGDMTFICPECDTSTTFQVWNCLRGHLWRSHQIDIELYSCEICDYKTFSLSKLNSIHKLIHSETKTFLCDICAKAFKNPKQLRNHKIIHNPKYKELTTQCEICHRAFANKRLLKLHVEGLHQQLKRFLCNYCGYKANSKSAVQLHERKHTGQRPYSCKLCSYTTADHNSFRRHNLRHTGQYSYQCSICNYACIQSSTFKIHLKSKHPNAERKITFSCKLCNFKSLREGNYLGHIAKHNESFCELLRDVTPQAHAQSQPQPPLSVTLTDDDSNASKSLKLTDDTDKTLTYNGANCLIENPSTTLDDPLQFTQNILGESFLVSSDKSQNINVIENTLVQNCDNKIDLNSLPIFINTNKNIYLNQSCVDSDLTNLKTNKSSLGKSEASLNVKTQVDTPTKFLFVSTSVDYPL